MLNNRQVVYLRKLAHALSPVVYIGGEGVTDAVLNEVDMQLKHHELIKLKVRVTDRDQRRGIMQHIVDHVGADIVSSIGRVATIYRAPIDDRQPRITLPI